MNGEDIALRDKFAIALAPAVLAEANSLSSGVADVWRMAQALVDHRTSLIKAEEEAGRAKDQRRYEVSLADQHEDEPVQ